MKTNPFTPDEERALVESMQKGDQVAFERLMKEYYGEYIKQLCLRTIPHQHIVDDAISMAMENIWKNSHLFEFKSSFKTWVHAVTFNISINMIKKEDRYWRGRNCIEADEKDHHLLVTSCKRNRPEQNLMYKEMLQVVLLALSQLSEQHRKVLILTEDNWSSKQIANECGIPAGTIRSQIWYARRRVRNALLDAGMLR